MLKEIQARLKENQLFLKEIQIDFFPRNEPFQGVIPDFRQKTLSPRLSPGKGRLDGRGKPRIKSGDGHGIGPRSSLSEGVGLCPRIVDVDRVHWDHDNAEFDFPEVNVLEMFEDDIRKRYPARGIGY